MSDGKGSEAICPTCGKTFVRARKGHTYCSRLCKERALRQGKRVRKKTNGGGMLPRIDGKRSEAISQGCGKALKNGFYSHVCKQCKKRFTSTSHMRSYCSETCRQIACEQNKKTQRMKNQGEDLLVMIMQDIPVNREMRPKVGKIYFAKRYTQYGGSTVIIPEIGKFGLVIRTGEYKIIKEA